MGKSIKKAKVNVGAWSAARGKEKAAVWMDTAAGELPRQSGGGVLLFSSPCLAQVVFVKLTVCALKRITGVENLRVNASYNLRDDFIEAG